MAASTKTESKAVEPPRKARRERRREAREGVIKAALELADRGSFRDVTVEGIAREVGISRNAFYTHFQDKHELLLNAVEEVSDQLYEMSERWWQGVGPPAERVRRALDGIVSVYAEHAALLRVAAEVSAYDEEVRTVWLAIAERFIEWTAAEIRSEQDLGLIPQTLAPRSTAEALFWMAERCCYAYLGRGERKPEQVVAGLAPVWTAALYPGVIPAGRLSPRT